MLGKAKEQSRLSYHQRFTRWQSAGGERWWELRKLLLAYTGWSPSGCSVASNFAQVQITADYILIRAVT